MEAKAKGVSSLTHITSNQAATTIIDNNQRVINLLPIRASASASSTSSWYSSAQQPEILVSRSMPSWYDMWMCLVDFVALALAQQRSGNNQ